MPASSETSEEIEIAAAVWAMKDRPLDAADEARLREWLAGDTRRRGALLRAQATLVSVARARALGPAANWTAKPRPFAGKLSRRHLLAAAGGAGGLAAAGVAGFLIGRHDDATTTEVGEIRRLPMSDGSIATINTDSTIKVSMTRERRIVDLVKGEAWFKVAHNKTRPFIVMAGLARVQAVGTAFSVRRLGDKTEVQVTEGTVKAWQNSTGQDSTGQDSAGAPAVWLKAGDTALIGPQGDVSKTHAPQAIDDALAWRQGQIALTGQTLAVAASEYNRYNQTKIVIEDRDLAGERLLGRFNADDPEGFSNAISRAFAVGMRRENNTIYLGKESGQKN